MDMENRGGRMHSRVHTELYVHTICKKYDEQNRDHVCHRRLWGGQGICGFLRKLCCGGILWTDGAAVCLPAFLITFANANLFGWWQGAILSWSSAMAGAALCFYIARILGRDAAEKLTSKAGLKQIDTFFDRYGKNTILICRLLPFVSFDIVSYGAGLTSMPFLSFFMATGIGQLPATIVYSYVGGMLTGGARFFVTGLMILFALSAFVVMVRKIYIEKQGKTRRKK